MIPLHKYSYPYLGQLEFSSEAFILLVGVTRLWVKLTCGKFNWMGMIWKDTHILIDIQQLIMHIRAKIKPRGQKNSL